MEYPFKNLQPLDEATARTGYYRDWSHIDADTFHQISELVTFIREKGYGSDTREAIAQALERVYHDALMSGNANMEVSMARGHFRDLAARLDAGDATVTAGLTDLNESLKNIDVNWINKNLGKFDQTFMSEEFLQQMVGTTPINAVPADDGVTTQKIANNATTTPKRTVLGERGEVIGARPATVNFITNQIIYSSGTSHRIFYRNKSHTIPSDTIVPFNAGDGIVIVLFNTATNLIRTTNHTAMVFSEHDILLGLAYVNASNLRGADMFGNYEYIGDNYKAYDSGYLITSDKIKVDFTNKKITIPTGINYMIYKGRSNPVPAGDIDFSTQSSFLIRVFYNIANNQFVFKNYNEAVSDTLVYVGVIYPNSNKYLFNGQEQEKLASDFSAVNHNFENMIWSWWIYPLAKRYVGVRDKTYYGFTDNEGYSGVASLDNLTGEHTKIKLKKELPDDHNATAVEIMDDGKILAAYPTGHGSDGIMRIRISENRENIEKFEDEIQLDLGGKLTYAQLFKGAGKYYLFYRNYPSQVQAEGGYFYISSVDGRTWSNPVHAITMPFTVYPKIQYVSDNPNLLRVIVTDNGVAYNCDFRLGFFNMETGKMEKADGTVIDGTATDADMPIIVARDNGRYQRLLDVAVTEKSRTVIAYSTYSPPSSGILDCDYRISYWTGTLRTINLGSAGEPFYVPSRYVGGISFIDANNIVMSREDSDKWYIEKWSTSDSITWSKAQQLHESATGIVAARPVVEIGGNRVIWHEGVFNPSNYKDFTTDLRFKYL